MAFVKDLILPEKVPIISQPGVVLFPQGFLPMTLVDPDPIQVIEDAIRKERFIGVVQPRDDKLLFNSGCLGRITTFSENADGLFIVLYGMCRFKVTHELRRRHKCRRVEADYIPYVHDMAELHADTMDRGRLIRVLKTYMVRNEIATSLDDLEDASDERLITAIAMSAPFSPQEKQAILELPTMSERCSMTTALIEMATIDQEQPTETCH